MLQGDPSPYINPLCNWLFVQQGVSPFIEQSIILLVKGLKSENKETALKSIDDSIHFHFKDAVFFDKYFRSNRKFFDPNGYPKDGRKSKVFT